ncbi:hypothetical protein [Sphingomonas sp. VNH70]|jgi:hypothetical protein|uniref:hypothetical protein n=1 Tax=Sphingomonas silueang TaxID=3156617 RepID=UPI0032B50655
MSDDAAPSAKLAELAVDQLIQSGLIRAEKRDAVISKIAAGHMKGEDWRLEIDLSVEKAGEA